MLFITQIKHHCEILPYSTPIGCLLSNHLDLLKDTTVEFMAKELCNKTTADMRMWVWIQ